MTPSNPASGTNEAAERIFKRRHPIGHTGTERREFMAGWDAALATERAIGAALDVTAFREFERDILMWTHPRDQGHVLNAITRLRARLASETPRPGERSGAAWEGYDPKARRADGRAGKPTHRATLSQPGGSDAE